MKPAKIAITHIVLTSIALLFVLPFLWMLTTSLKPVSETMTAPPRWKPSSLQFHNYPDAINYGREQVGYIPFLVYARNTIVITILTIIGSVVSNSLVAYAFARLKWPGRDLFFGVTLATMMVPFPVTMVPSFALFKWLGWVGTFKPLWVPAYLGSAFSIFLLRQFFLKIPNELSGAAKIDGATEFQTFTDIILPLAKPARGGGAVCLDGLVE